MQVNETLNEGLQREFTIIISAADLDAELNSRLSEIAPRVSLPGGTRHVRLQRPVALAEDGVLAAEQRQEGPLVTAEAGPGLLVGRHRRVVRAGRHQSREGACSRLEAAARERSVVRRPLGAGEPAGAPDVDDAAGREDG